MNLETARILAQAIKTRDTACKGLLGVAGGVEQHIVIPDPLASVMMDLAGTYVHEQRIINKIVAEDVDE